MITFPNDIYVICAYISMNVLFYLVSKIPWTRRATWAATEAVAAPLCTHTGAFSKLWTG